MTATVNFDGEVLRGTDWFNHDYTGQRVAVLAPGREAAQIVPEVAATASSVKVFQEEPDWVVPTRVPGGRAVSAVVSRLFLRTQVKDPWIRRLLTPQRYDSRQVAVSVGYYDALRRPHCKLITWPVYALAEHGVRTAEGVEHQVDCVVLGPSSVFAGDTTFEGRPA